MTMKTIKATITGRVTGVGFRYSAWLEARHRPGLHGWVRNRDARTVEALVQGPPSEVDEMVAWLRHGPPGAAVEECRTEELAAEPHLDSFQVK